MQLQSELGARIAKENQAKILGFAWFYLVDSGFFNELRPKK
jgi:hypothetical protein